MNHNNHQEHQEDDALAASFHAFRSEFLNCTTKLLNSRTGDGNLTLSWIEQCFKLLPMINKAFAKLILDINYPMSKWEIKSKEDYLKYSLKLLDLLNLISSSISPLGQAKISLSHAIGLVETSPSSAVAWLRPMEVKSLCIDFKDQENEKEGNERFCMDKEMVISHALMEIKGIGLWICCVALAGLAGDSKAYLENRQWGHELSSSWLVNLDLDIWKGCELEEVKEVNEAVVGLKTVLEGGSGGDEAKDLAKDLERRLKGFEKLLDAIGMEVEGIFSEVLAARSKLLDCFRFW